MQGFVNFAFDIGNVLSIVIPLCCYLFGVSMFLFAGYGAWHCTKPGSYWERHKPLIALELLTGSVLVSFDQFLNFANGTFGGNVTTSVAAGATSYTPPTINATSLIGTTPEQTITTLITDFSYFFIAYGAFICFLAVMSLRAVGQGRRNHGISLPLIMLVFGVALMNIQTFTTTIMGYFNTGA
jgi:hypothetical protein